MFGCVDTYDLYFGELVQAVQSAHVLAVRTCFAAEALGVGAVLDRQLRLVENNVAIEVGYRHFGGRNQIEVVHFAVVHLSLFIRQLACSVTRSGVDHGRRHDLGVTGFVGFRKEEIDEGTLEACTLTDIHRETGTGDLDAEVKIDKVVFLGKFPMREFGFVVVHVAYPRTNGVATMMRHIGFHHEIIFRARACGHYIIRYIRDSEQQLGLRILRLFHSYIVRRNIVLQLSGLCFGGLSLFAFALRHECADRFADLVHLRSGSIFLLLCGFA